MLSLRFSGFLPGVSFNLSKKLPRWWIGNCKSLGVNVGVHDVLMGQDPIQGDFCIDSDFDLGLDIEALINMNE